MTNLLSIIITQIKLQNKLSILFNILLVFLVYIFVTIDFLVIAWRRTYVIWTRILCLYHCLLKYHQCYYIILSVPYVFGYSSIYNQCIEALKWLRIIVRCSTQCLYGVGNFCVWFEAELVGFHQKMYIHLTLFFATQFDYQTINLHRFLQLVV